MITKQLAESYGFKRIDTPIFEFTELFSKSVGATTDIVEKQMYTFRTKGGDSVTLRPEETASIVRSYIMHGMHAFSQPVKLYYIGPMFRYESPQKGRYRQFHQFGVEVLGEASPVIEAQVIQLFFQIFKSLGVKATVEVNSIGCRQCRPVYKKLLSSYYRSRSKQVCVDCRKRRGTNILRILDCKEEKCQIVKQSAPPIVDHLCDGCKGHFKTFLEFIEELDLPFFLNQHLVRGLDYYSKTVFEFLPEETDSNESVRSQVAIGGGGRYDYLAELLWRRNVPAAGAALGLERIVELMKEHGAKVEHGTRPLVFFIQLGETAKKKGLRIFDEFVKSKIPITESFGKDSIRTQLGLANKARVKYALILGYKEVLEETIIIRDMERSSQETVPLGEAVKEIKKRLKLRAS